MGCVEILYTKYGLGRRLKNTILLSESLKKDKKLHDWILNHEMQHSNKASVKDIKQDFKVDKEMNLKMLSFMLENPRTWTQWIPCLYFRKKLYWDVSLLFMYAIAVCILIVAFQSVMFFVGT